MAFLATRLGYLIAVGILFYGSYGFSNWLTAQRAPVPEIVFAWEESIPFWAWTIVPYWTLNLLYSLAFFLAKSREELFAYLRQLLAAQAIAVGCFLLFPLQFSWAKPAVSGFSGFLFNSLATFDQPYNQAPSLHIILTIVVGTFYWCYLPKKWHLPLLLWLALIAASILTTYQHHFIDLPTGALVGWLVVWVLPYQQPSPLRKAQGLNPPQATPLKWYLLGALSAAALAFSGGVWLWSLWIAVALLLVAYAYWRGGAAVFQKQPNGRCSTAATMLLLPYLIGVRLNMAYWLNGKPKSAEVAPRLFIGSLTQAAQFDAVVDLCAEYPSAHGNADYVSVPMLDMTAPAAQDLATAARAVEAFYRKNQTVLVCCALGYGRSAAVLLVWLAVFGGGETLEQAVQTLRAARPKIVLPPATEQRVREAIEICKREKFAKFS